VPPLPLLNYYSLSVFSHSHKLFREHDLSGAIESTGKTAEDANDPIYKLSKILDRCWVQKRTISSDDSEICLLNGDFLTCADTRYLFPWDYVCPVSEE